MDMLRRYLKKINILYFTEKYDSILVLDLADFIIQNGGLDLKNKIDR